jgi:hypothetical protein
MTMKRFTQFSTLTLITLLISTLAQATVFDTVNGLKYSIDTLKNEASLVENSLGGYSGDIVVPEKITSGGKEYAVTSFGESCFLLCSKLTSITIPSSVKFLGNKCFYYCYGLTSIDIPSSVTSLGYSCFYFCKNLRSINIPSSVTSLGNDCFDNCSRLTSIDIPSSVTDIGEYCFANCYELTSITIPESVTILKNGCFFECSKLASITIPSSVTSLGSYCFSYCSNITSIICYATTPPECNQKVFEGCDKFLCNLYVPQESIDKYNVADVWETFPYIYAIGGSGESDQINSTSTSGTVASCSNGVITISGLNALENVTFYSLSGKQLGTATAVDGTATYAVNGTGDIVIAKFGGTSMKIVTK